MHTPFVAFIPLSNWLRGFDRYGMRYSKALIPESSFPDAFYMLREDEPRAPGLEKARRLVRKLARPNDRVVALRARLPTGPGAMQPNDVTGTGVGWRWPRAEVPLSGVAWVDEGGALIPTRHEEITAQAYRVDDCGLLPWSECRPRSFSVLPIARACQASCAFCFSKSSVSDAVRQRHAPLNDQVAWAELARARGAERAVITGGGEPTLLPAAMLRTLVSELSRRFPSTLLITNGSALEVELLQSLVDAGLTTLAVSRHGLTLEHDARIMGLPVDSGALGLRAASLGLRTRAICVLQRGGVDSATKVRAYLERSAREGFAEVCFKELYVSSLAENPWAPSAVNRFCEENQVPLVEVIEALSALGFVSTATLPWGSPVFEGELLGRRLKVAAYTEPSVGWERTHGLVRSWNLLADGQCLASLEDPASKLVRCPFPARRKRRTRASREERSGRGRARMKLDEFLKERERLRATGLIDLSELNLYRSLALAPIAPSTHAEAPYRCHLAERFLAHLKLSQDLKPRTLVSHGVRRSLRALFGVLAARGANIGIPDDVYPVYLQLAADAGARVTTWSARSGIPGDETLATLDALLVCEPLKPWGTSLSDVDAARLSEWAETRMLVIDSAYATPPGARALALMHDQRAVLLVSLSKGWLIPDHAGLCIVPSRFQQSAREALASLPKEELRLRIGYAALTEHADRVVQVGTTLTALATKLDAFTAQRPELAATRCAGYFATTQCSFAQLLEQGILGVPASVFGGREGCVLSSLPVA